MQLLLCFVLVLHVLLVRTVICLPFSCCRRRRQHKSDRANEDNLPTRFLIFFTRGDMAPNEALSLYRRIFRLHRQKLPFHLRQLGDSYVRFVLSYVSTVCCPARVDQPHSHAERSFGDTKKRRLNGYSHFSLSGKAMLTCCSNRAQWLAR